MGPGSGDNLHKFIQSNNHYLVHSCLVLVRNMHSSLLEMSRGSAFLRETSSGKALGNA
jgi:hypothetical protein